MANRHDRRRNDELVRKLVELPPLSTVVYNGAVNFARNHYIVTTLWLLGLFMLQFGLGFVSSPEALEAYESAMSTVDHKKMHDVQKKLAVAQRDYYDSKGWFSCDARCTQNYERLQQWEAKYRKLQDEEATTVAQAKSHVGIFSDYGVQEVRDLFWGIFAKGKGFAKRASMWDLLFMGIGSMGRDESLVAFILRWLFQVLINFTMGMIGTLVAFIWYVYDVIKSYQPDPISAAIAFFLFCVAAISAVATYLLLLYGIAGGGLYFVARSVAVAQLEGGTASSRRDYIREPSARDSADLIPGTRVTIQGLTSAAELNGQSATVTDNSGERIRVQLEEGREIAVRASNLIPQNRSD